MEADASASPRLKLKPICRWLSVVIYNRLYTGPVRAYVKGYICCIRAREHSDVRMSAVLNICIQGNIYIYICVCVYVYIYTYMHIHIHTHLREDCTYVCTCA
jgi:hypothetical protein